MQELVDKLINAKEREEIVEAFEKLLNQIEKLDGEEKERLLRLLIVKAEYKQEELEKQNRFLDSNIYLYEKDISIQAAIIEELIVAVKNNEYIDENMRYLKNKFLRKNKKENKKAKEIHADTVKKIITILQKEYRFIDILNASKTKISILFFDEVEKNDLEVVNYNVIKNNQFSLHIYRMKGNNEIASILEQFGLIINEMLVGDSQRVPDSFIQFCKERGIELEEESKECISIFMQLFALATIIKVEGTEEKGEKEVIAYYENLIGELYHRVCENNGKKEWEDNKKCPCGSGKKYIKCCKKKEIKYYQLEDENHYQKSLPMAEPLEEMFYQRRVDFRKWFGRDVKPEEYIMPELLKQDFRELERMLKQQFPQEVDKVYAYAKTGMLLTEHNINQYSDMDIAEYKEAVKEYRKLMKQNIANNKANELQIIEFVNYEMQLLLKEEHEPINFCLRLIMKELSEKIARDESLVVENKEDFFAYCLYKINRDLKAIRHIQEEGHFEIIMATVRFVYEILIHILSYMKDEKLFEEKIIAIAGIEKGTFTRKSKHIVIEKATGKECNTKIKISDLAEKAGNNYRELYNTLYSETSSFIHVDVLAAHKIFNDNDLFLDLDESHVAAIIAITLSIITITKFSQYEKISKKLQKDLIYYTNSIAKKLERILQEIKIVDDKPIYDILIQCLELDKRNYKINYERKKKTEMI